MSGRFPGKQFTSFQIIIAGFLAVILAGALLLALALCKSIAESHQGRITLTDNVPTGCCFTISLPMKEVQINE